ncbi:MAG: DNA topoisomerase VI subunit B [Candidatus Bathyarchaeota archaeon]|nr:DNA topoisomerase VI subunit B [Candidatus Bathyarchaeota archaeon]
MVEVFEEISPADFFYRNRDIAGFTNPSRAIYSTIRELVENSLDACEIHKILPDVYIRLLKESDSSGEPNKYRIRVEDNGSGLPSDIVPLAFGQVLFGSKYKLRQTRGTFGLGGKMAVLYGQITTHSETKIISSNGKSKIFEFHLMMDIKNNKPEILKKETYHNNSKWHGTIIEFLTEADYTRAKAKILEYLKQTAIVAPYANITFVDPKGRFYKFDRFTTTMPRPSIETTPHPHGVDVETIKRLVGITKVKNMKDFMREHFQRVGETTAIKFLDFSKVDQKRNPLDITPEEIVLLVNGMKNYNAFLPPDASCLSPLGEESLKTGIQKEFNPEFIAVHQRKPSAYSGFPFIIEAGVAYGGNIPRTGNILLYRFANKIPLLFDEASDVSWKVIHNMVNWRHYKISADDPLAVFTHICSLKIPYKTVGKEFIADRPEVEREILNAIREVARHLSIYLSRKNFIEKERKRLDIFSKYLPKMASFSTKLAKKEKEPDIMPLLRGLKKYEEQKE